jgi:membrane-associated phospholipid phosphatase
MLHTQLRKKEARGPLAPSPKFCKIEGVRLEFFDPNRTTLVDLSAVDVLNIFAILLLAIIVAVLQRQLGDMALPLLATFASLIGLTALLVYLSSRGQPWHALHDFSSTFTVIAVFSTLGPIIDCVRPVRWDLTFARLDAALVGKLAGEWRALLGRPSWFVDCVYVLYVSYFFVPFVLGIVAYRRQSTAEFRSLIFTIVLTFYLTYVGYFLFPTLGPRVPRDTESLAIGGGAVSEAVRSFLHFAEHNPTDAFPSGHVAIALLSVFLARRVSAGLSMIYIPLVAGIIFSTVYLHYHYVVDVLAGAVLAGAAWRLGPRLEPWCEPQAFMKRVAVRFGIR